LHKSLRKNAASVIIADLNLIAMDTVLKTLDTSKDQQHFSVRADISSEGFVSQLLEIVLNKYKKPPEIIVNNAGVTKDRSFHRMTVEEYDWVLSTNLKGPFLVTQAFTRSMVENNFPCGSVINISSIVGKVGNFGQANYAASKSGLIGLTKTVAKELGRFNIRCNAVLPGYIETKMSAKVPENISQAIKSQIPLKNAFGKPEDVANACLFLASDLSRYVTGACLEVTGGLSM